MDLGLAWINDLVLWLARWIPRWDVCEPTHRVVKFRGSFLRGLIGKQAMDVVVVQPGIFWYWPAATRIVKYPVVRQSVDLPSQSLDTKDGKAIMVSAVLVVEISDPIKALTANYDVDGTISEVGLAATVDVVVKRTAAELRKAFADETVDKELKEAARKILSKYGVKVVDAFFTDCAKHSAIRCEGGGTVVPHTPEDDK